MIIEHGGYRLDVEIDWESCDCYGITGLSFMIESIDDRDPTPEEIERLDEELLARHNTDNILMQRVRDYIYNYYQD